MKVSSETVATREVELTIEPEADFIEKSMRQAARRISRIRPVPGYRPGKAPYALVERVFGRETILNEALQETGQGLFSQAVTTAQVEPYEARPLEVVSVDPTVLKVRIPLMPLTTLGDYKALHIDAEPQVELDEERVDEEIETIRRRHAEYEPVERPLELGDQMVATIKGTADGDEVLVDRQSSTHDVNAKMSPPGFAEAIVGMKAGDSRQFTLSYPADFENEELAGKNVVFDVAVETVRQVNLPAVDDELAKTVGDFGTAAEMREKVAQRLKERLEAEAKNRELSAAVEALVTASSVEFPAAALETEVSSILETRKVRLRQMGFDYNRYLQMIGRTDAQMREEVLPEAERNLTRQMALYQFAISEGLQVSAEVLNEHMDRIAASYGERAEEVRKQLDEGRVRLSIYMDVLQDKAAEHLADVLTGRAESTAKPTAEQIATETEETETPAVEEQAADESTEA